MTLGAYAISIPVVSYPSIFIDSINYVRQNYRRRNNEGNWIDSMNSIDPKVSLDELRANDYFSLKKNLVPEATKTMIDELRRANAARRDQSIIFLYLIYFSFVHLSSHTIIP